MPTWDKLSDASVRELAAFDEDVVRNTMNSEYQAEYADKMGQFWDAGGNDFDPDQIAGFTAKMEKPDRDLFLARHEVRTEIGANAEFTGNGLTANSTPGNSKIGIVETLSLERDLPDLSTLQNNGTVKTINLKSL